MQKKFAISNGPRRLGQAKVGLTAQSRFLLTPEWVWPSGVAPGGLMSAAKRNRQTKPPPSAAAPPSPEWSGRRIETWAIDRLKPLRQERPQAQRRADPPDTGQPARVRLDDPDPRPGRRHGHRRPWTASRRHCRGHQRGPGHHRDRLGRKRSAAPTRSPTTG
jgi:hypothetical protein